MLEPPLVILDEPTANLAPMIAMSAALSSSSLSWAAAGRVSRR